MNMDQRVIITVCKEVGCCDTCCLRYVGLKNPSAFEAPHEHVSQILHSTCEEDAHIDAAAPSEPAPPPDDDVTPPKRMKTTDTCVSCVGVLQDEAWDECLAAARRTLDEKRYECEEFACALSAPLATILRERAVAALLARRLPGYEHQTVTPLKEAWKWRRGSSLARCCGMRLVAGGGAPLLVTLQLEYEEDARELAALGRGAGGTRRAAQDACARAAPARLIACAGPPPCRARAAAALAEARPLALGGRYVKLSRELPQTPWVVEGRRALPSSVQDVIFAPLAALLGLSAAEAERRLKFMSAGREDVDVRCLGDGRPFAVEVADPRREPAPEELARVCELISESGEVRVDKLVPVSREKLAELKHGEESKCKTYEALCIKLAHSAEDAAEAGAGAAVRVTARDVARLEAAAAGAVRQRTPLRVLHRRALLARARHVAVERAARVPGHAALLALRLRTAAGTYVKEWAHGELRRTRPALPDLLRAPADILALDVTAVHLAWP